MKNFQSHRAQRGNVLFIILLAIALFAALSYAALQGSRTGTAGLTDEQAKIVAQEVMTYGNTVADAVQKLRLRGVTENQISFENTVFKNTSGTLYHAVGSNTNCTNDGCKIFSLNGGAVTAQKIGPNGVVASTGNEAGSWIAYSAAWQGVGTSAGDLLFAMAKPSLKVCQYINRMAGVSSTTSDLPPAFTPTATTFNGTYSNSAFGAPANLNGKTEFCYENIATPGAYVYIRVVLAR
jgi:hypothetical protein